MPLAIVLGALDYAMLNIIGATAIPDGFQNNADYIQNLQSLSGVSSFPVLYAVQDKLGTTGVVLLGTAIFCALSSSIIGFYQVLIK